jgi:muramoyltetrapeptide carboxypeptidase LdcA involved in peptidoglycan recycling
VITYMITPTALQKGDRVTVIAPAGPPEKEHLFQGIRVMEMMGTSDSYSGILVKVRR